MNPSISPLPEPQTRLGIHYFPDTLHYRESDLQTWLPRLKSLGISWLVLQAIPDRTIPENFLQGLIDENIEPIIQLDLKIDSLPARDELQTLFETYARWDVNGIVLLDKPNSRNSWRSSNWVQQDLVERFLNNYLPIAKQVLDAGLTPIFPPLHPGGSYWDTAFLRSSLESMIRRDETDLLNNLVLSAYAWTGSHSLNWGAGGQTSWPDSKPYFTPEGSQDQQGFRIFDWYGTVTEEILGEKSPIMLFEVGVTGDPQEQSSTNPSSGQQAAINLSIAKLTMDETVNDPKDPQVVLEPIPDHVIASNFWVLSTAKDSPYQFQSWFSPDQEGAPIVKLLANCISEREQSPKTIKSSRVYPTSGQQKTGGTIHPDNPQKKTNKRKQPIRHYLLLPTYEWGVADWHLEVINPFVKKYRPTIGFSLSEAALADRVTIIGNQKTFPEEIITRLRQRGCRVERISGDGTSIATQLSER